jgi:hypothetical protein
LAFDLVIKKKLQNLRVVNFDFFTEKIIIFAMENGGAVNTTILGYFFWLK